MPKKKNDPVKIERLYWAQSAESGKLYEAGGGNYVSSIVYDEKYRKTLSRERHAPLLDIDFKVALHPMRAKQVALVLARDMSVEGAGALDALLRRHRWGYVRGRQSELVATSIVFEVPVRLFPSTTKDHFHLYIDAILKRDDHLRLIECCRFAGIIDDKYAEMVKKLDRGMLLRQGHKKTIVNRYKKISDGAERRSSPRVNVGNSYFNDNDYLNP